MASVITMEKKKDNSSAEKKVDGFMTRHRKPILIVALIIVAAAIGICVFVGIKDSQRKNKLSAIDSIEYSYIKDYDALSEEEIVSRQNEALDKLKEFETVGGVVGVRANMLAADICFAKKDFVNSKDYWIAAAEADKKAYTAPICYYNAGVCFEESGDNQTAATYYQMAVEDKSFLLVSKALLSLGRVKEASGDYAGAAELYQKMVDEYGADGWTKLAQSRLIQLKIEGKIN